MLWVIALWTTEYAGLLPGGVSPRFSNVWKPLAADMKQEVLEWSMERWSSQWDYWTS